MDVYVCAYLYAMYVYACLSLNACEYTCIDTHPLVRIDGYVVEILKKDQKYY